MTDRDEIIRLLVEAGDCCGCIDSMKPLRPIMDALRVAQNMTFESELRLKLAEDHAEVKRALGPNAQVAFEVHATGDGILSGCYSVGIGSKHEHTFDVLGRGASVKEAIENTLSKARPR